MVLLGKLSLRLRYGFMEKKFLIISLLIALNFGLAWNLLKVHPVLQLHMLDVGQGDALLLTTAEQNHILIDGGPDNSVLEQLGNVLPLFWKEIDLMVLTHPHDDHVVGLVPVLDRLQVNAILLTGVEYGNDAYEALLQKALEKKIPVYTARADLDFSFGDTKLDVLFPFESMTGQEIENVNNSSIVMRVTQGEHEIMLTGDAEQELEAQLVEDGGDTILSADILKAGHHGSKTASTLDFLESVAPKLMLISVGLANDFGHPHEETLQKADDLGISILRTDQDGCISVYFADETDDADGEPGGFYASPCRFIFAPSWRSLWSSAS